MKWHRVYGTLLRHLYVFKHSFNRMSDSFYWPFIDLLLWGLTITYVKSTSSEPNNIVFVVISGILLWLITWRGQYEISVGLLEELWSKNLINMFVSPLKLWEWVMAGVILGVMKALMSVTFASVVAYFLYHVNMLKFGLSLLPIAVLLLMTGWWVGFIIAGLILRYGTRVEQFAWSTIYILAPFSVAYYPLSILPPWAQQVAHLVPTSYVFEAARKFIRTGNLDWNMLALSFLLNCVYLILAVVFLQRSFKKTLEKGLNKVY